MPWQIGEVFSPPKAARDLKDGEMFTNERGGGPWIMADGRPWALKLYITGTNRFPEKWDIPTNFSDFDTPKFYPVTLKWT
jgi:hypothetical protein